MEKSEKSIMEKYIKQIRRTLGLLSSMVRSGENHSKSSEKALRNSLSGLDELVLIMKEIYIDGNNGGNYVKIQQLDDNRILLEIGDCCVKTAELIVTAEVLSSFLTKCSLVENKSLLDVMKDCMSWDEKTNEEFSKGCKSL